MRLQLLSEAENAVSVTQYRSRPYIQIPHQRTSHSKTPVTKLGPGPSPRYDVRASADCRRRPTSAGGTENAGVENAGVEIAAR